jgi:Effector Associated Constant Component 1
VEGHRVGVVKVEVRFHAAEAEELDRLTSQLRTELLQLDIDDVRRDREGVPPPGARGVDVAALSQLIVSVGQVPGTLASLVRTVAGWLGHRSGRSVRLEIDGDTIELTGASDEQQQRLIDSWLARHSAK